MELLNYYELYPAQKDCIQYLESIVWSGSPICPYCNSKYNTQLTNEARRHCNTCNTSFSVTVNSMFHKTKVDLQKWFYAIDLVKSENITNRAMADKLNVTKDTANKMINTIKKEIGKNSPLIQLSHGQNIKSHT